MGFGNSYERKLTLDRRAAKKQRAKQQSQVQIVHYRAMDNPEWPGRQMVFAIFLVWFVLNLTRNRNRNRLARRRLRLRLGLRLRKEPFWEFGLRVKRTLQAGAEIAEW